MSGHVQSVFFYILLRLTNDPNPLFPFKFFNGAPVVGALVSPALREREKVQGPFNDPAIQAARLRGPKDSRLRLTVSRKGESEPLVKLITRAEVR